MRKYKIFDYNDKFLCKTQYKEKMKFNEEGWDKLVKNKNILQKTQYTQI